MKRFFVLLAPVSILQLLATLGSAAENYQPIPAQVTTFFGASPPSDAIVLFDGSDMNAWHTASEEESAGWEVSDNAVTVAQGTGSLKTKQVFGDMQLHVEWRPTDIIEGKGQSRGNSGVFLSSLYEVQILDSWNNPTYVNGQAGAIYLQHPPLVNVAKPPGEWQTFDIFFTAPLYTADGQLEAPAFVTVLHNGVLILNNVEILGSTYTPTPKYEVQCIPYSQRKQQDCSGKMPITIQDHGQIVSFRNMWVRNL